MSTFYLYKSQILLTTNSLVDPVNTEHFHLILAEAGRHCRHQYHIRRDPNKADNKQGRRCNRGYARKIKIPRTQHLL